jgi:hypothetical protein
MGHDKEPGNPQPSREAFRPFREACSLHRVNAAKTAVDIEPEALIC